MTKKCFIGIVAFMMTVTASAQLKLGLKGGFNLADVALTNLVNPDMESQYDPKFGWHAGLVAQSELDEKVGAAVELLYSNKGVHAVNNVNLHYVNLPVLIRYRIDERFTAEIGPQVGYLVLARAGGRNAGDLWNNKLDIGGCAGIQYVLGERVTMGGRYEAGFSSVIGQAGADPVKYQNRVFQVFVVLMLKRDY